MRVQVHVRMKEGYTEYFNEGMNTVDTLFILEPMHILIF